MSEIRPLIVPLGDRALLVRFAQGLDDAANRKAIAFAKRLERDPPPGVREIVSSLVSVAVHYDPLHIDCDTLSAQLRLHLGALQTSEPCQAKYFTIGVDYGGTEGPDIEDVAARLGFSVQTFINRHSAQNLRVLATGFAPGFVYCGMHDDGMILPRRTEVRARVSAGSILFAAGQTAIAATDIPTGWHVIGRTQFCNFNPARMPPTQLAAGDQIAFEDAR